MPAPRRTPRTHPPVRRVYESLATAATRTGVSERTVRRWVADGRLTAYRIGPRLLRVDPDEVDRLFERVPTAAGADVA